MYLEIFLADFAVFRVFWGISRDFAEMPEFRGSATARNIRSPVKVIILYTGHDSTVARIWVKLFSAVVCHLTGKEI